MSEDLTIDVEDLLNEIDMSSFPSARGRRAKEVREPLILGRARALSQEDIIVAHTVEPGPGIQPQSLVRLRTRHHRLAQLLSTGLSHTKIALVTGYSTSRISVLLNDPTFKELVAHYGKENHAVDVELRNRIEMLSLESVEVLQDRLEDNSDEFSNKELMELAEMTLDRTGFGKSSTVSVLHGLDDETIRLIQEQKDRSSTGQILNLSEGEFIDQGQILRSSESGVNDIDPLIPSPSEKISARLEEDQGGQVNPRRDLPALETGIYTDTAAEKWQHDRERTRVPEKVDNRGSGADIFELRPQIVRGDEPSGL